MIKFGIICALVCLSANVKAQQCRGDAQCVTLNACPGLYSQLLSKNITTAQRELLRILHCGFKGDMPMVCCPPIYATVENRGPGQNKASLLPSFGTCGNQSFTDKIVGGTQTDIEEYPWMALLRFDKPQGWGFYCGGVLISSRYVLTAAHCVSGASIPSNWVLSQVRLGEWDTKSSTDCDAGLCSDPPQDIEIEELIPHEDYDPSDGQQQNDIALLRLATPVRFNNFVQPICLPVTSQLRENNFVGYTVDVAGWGKTESRSESDVKLKVSVPVVTNAACGKTYSKVARQITNNQMCAGGVTGQDSCRGDSGGPLMVKVNENWIAIGVVSYGPSPCGTQNWPGVYTRNGAFMDWIISKLKP